MALTTSLYVVQIILSITMVIVVLLQVKSAGLGSAFGSSDASIYSTRRGFDRILFNFTIILGVTLLLTSLVILLATRTG